METSLSYKSKASYQVEVEYVFRVSKEIIANNQTEAIVMAEQMSPEEFIGSKRIDVCNLEDGQVVDIFLNDDLE